jgi:transposase-like protein
MQQITPDTAPMAIAPRDLLQELLRNGARDMLAKAVEQEVQDYLDAHAKILDERGHRLIVRNGYKDERTIQTGLGDIPVRQPRVNDKRIDEHGQRCRFVSQILPPYLRRTRSVEELIPWLYLRGISTGDFAQALEALLGPEASGLSATNIVRLKAVWEKDWSEWSGRSLAGKRYVYFWADGIHFNIRLEDADNNRQCILVIMGATADGTKELIAIADGYRESEQSWMEVLLSLKARGLEQGPELAVGDGALGFWKALRKVYSSTKEQRCWVHKEVNVTNKLPKSQQAKAKESLREIWMAANRADAVRAFDLFVEVYKAKYPGAAECLEKDRDELLAFYDFPAEHWLHIRTTNPIESTFATVRLRTVRTKGSGSRTACLTMVFKLAQCAQKTWRKLNGSALLPDVIAGVKFIDGAKAEAA